MSYPTDRSYLTSEQLLNFIHLTEMAGVTNTDKEIGDLIIWKKTLLKIVSEGKEKDTLLFTSTDPLEFNQLARRLLLTATFVDNGIIAVTYHNETQIRFQVQTPDDNVLKLCFNVENIDQFQGLREQIDVYAKTIENYVNEAQPESKVNT